MRKRITALATLAVIAVLITASFVLAASQRRLLTENLDEAIATLADEIQVLVEAGRLPPTLTGLGEDDTVAQVVVAGQVVATSANLTGQGPVGGRPAASQRLRTVRGLPHDAAAFRLLSRRFDGPKGETVIHVAGTLEDIRASATVLATSLSVIIPVVALLLAALIWWLVGRTLAPVEAIRAEVADIGGSGLHRRVPVPSGTDEIARLARTMNIMLERLDDAAQRQTRFVADASHELRSPLTRIRSELEVDLATQGDADFTATHRSVLEETLGLQRLVEDLLQLAQRQATAPALVQEPVDLDDILVAQARKLRAAGQVAVDISGVTGVQVLGHADQLARAVANLAENAARYATSTVVMTLIEHQGTAVLAVTDDGPGLAPVDRERVFDRFTRLDDARGPATGGAGLGLAIARDIAERHGGTLAVDANHHPGARFVMTLPVA